MGKLFSKEQVEIPRFFEILPHGQEFDMRSINNVLKELEDNTQNINEISIGSHNYDIEALSRLAETIQECQNITVANFSNVIHEQEDNSEYWEILNTTLMCLHNLYEVDLSKNNLTEYTIDILSFLFHSECLKVIKLNDNYLGVEGAMKLAEAFRNSELELYVFCAERNSFEDQGVLELSEAFSNMGSLRQVSLSENHLGKDGIIVLCRSLINNPQLQILDLRDSYANEDTAYISIKQLIEKLEFLSRVDLNDCFLGNNGAKCVLKALIGTNHNISQLMIAYNEIDDDECAEYLVELLKTKRLLQVMVN